MGSGERIRRRPPLWLVAALTVAVYLVGARLQQLDGRLLEPSAAGVEAFARYELGDFARAAAAYRRHFARTIAAGQTTYDAAYDAFLVGDVDQARALASKTIVGGPFDPDALLTLGEIDLDAGRYEPALASFRTILEHEPRHFDAAMLASIAALRAGQPTATLALLNQALRDWNDQRIGVLLSVLQVVGELEQMPAAAQPHAVLATYYRYLRVVDRANARGALRHAQLAIDAGDHPGDAYFTMGVVYYREDRPDDAVDAFEQAIAADPEHAEAHRWASLVYADRGDLKREYEMLGRAVEIAPHDPTYRILLSDVLTEKLGDYRQALALMTTAEAESPRDADVIGRIGWLHALMGSPTQALPYLERARALAPGQEWHHLWIAYALRRLGRDDDAVDHYRAALDINPYNAETHLSIAVLRQTEGRYAEAVPEYEQAIRLDRTNEENLIELCMLYHLASRFEEAEACARRFERAMPSNPDAPYLLRVLAGPVVGG